MTPSYSPEHGDFTSSDSIAQQIPPTTVDVHRLRGAEVEPVTAHTTTLST
ncbi:hypothetical protein F4560_001570 [Saccharothrix ecbatanensis]|uniref:FXSXX-COOH protein n=1 Tax=Saccharothrix ecbatanensis TaxID=1105145 RepID=A0A7W9HGG0_9PSEU|nr:hypothetical protein [Saccharothrix ecbatanensis]